MPTTGDMAIRGSAAQSRGCIVATRTKLRSIPQPPATSQLAGYALWEITK